MAFTRNTIAVNNISLQPDKPVVSAATLKGLFDKTGSDEKAYNNDVLLVELESTTNGDSGADNIGATPLSGGVANTVQGIVEELDAKAVSGVGALNTHKASSDHDSRYYTETELNNGQLDTRYYTETELNNGQLDNRYFTETETNNLLAAKQNTITGAASTVVSTNLGSERVVVSSPAGKIDQSTVTSAELLHVSGVTSGIQSQLNTITSNVSNSATKNYVDTELANKANTSLNNVTSRTVARQNVGIFVLNPTTFPNGPQQAGFTVANGDLWFW
jgi:hypothetical protein